MTTWEILLTAWNWDFTTLVIGGGLIAALWWGSRNVTSSAQKLALIRGSQPTPAIKSTSYWRLLAMGVLVVALFSPVATLARTYLFSAHMLQHLLLLLVVPPLWLLSRPRPAPEAATGSKLQEAGSGSPLTRAGHALLALPVAWLAGVAAMWLWHLPTLCNAATSSTAVYHLQTVSLLTLGTLFWRPLVGPHTDQLLNPLAGIAYLVSACFACTLMGIYVTFTPLNVCSIYQHPPDPLGILPLLRSQWGLTPTLDQQLGGLLMWVPACLIYLVGVVGQLARWYTAAEGELHRTRFAESLS
jgi:putative membrane protein